MVRCGLPFGLCFGGLDAPQCIPHEGAEVPWVLCQSERTPIRRRKSGGKSPIHGNCQADEIRLQSSDLRHDYTNP
jgi:hypothetical protein